MTSLKSVFTFLVTMLIVSSAYSNLPTQILKLGDLLFNENALIKQLKTSGVPNSDAIRLAQDAQTALSAMGIQIKKANGSFAKSEEIMKFVNSLNQTTMDPAVHLKMSMELEKFLNQDYKSASQKDLMETLSRIFYFADSTGKLGAIVTCSACTHDAAFPGLTHTLRYHPNSKTIFEQIVNNKDHKTLFKDINEEIKGINKNNKNLKVPLIKKIAPEDLRPMRLFLEGLNSESKEVRDYVKAVLELGDLTEHRLWDNPELFNNNTDDLPGFTDLVKEISKYKKERDYDFEKSFNDVLSLRAGKDVDKRAKFTELMSKRCFLKR